MKKIFIIFAAMAAVLSSCSKSGLESATANESKDIVLNISVSNPGADDTKALIKTGWAANDEIFIWYDGNTDATPDLVIKYDASNTKWIQNQDATVSGNKPSTGASKYAKALYNGTVKVASKDEYTYDGTTLTFNIENWTFLTEVQVVVKGLTSTSAGSYTLSCDKFTPCTGNGYTVNADGIIATKGTKGTAVTGISNTDGVAFVFATADYSPTAVDYTFTLKDNTSGSEVTKVYKPNVAIAAKEGKSSIKALAIANTKFVPDGFVDMGVTNASGKPVYWRTANLGASSVTDYGNYYSWGDVTGYKPSGTSFTHSFDWSHDKFGQTVSKWDTYCTNYVLKSTYDAAYNADNTWRMPTKEDFQKLYAACGGAGTSCTPTSGGSSSTTNRGIYWCNKSYNGVSGVLFIAQDYGPHLFFPAAGNGNDTTLEDASFWGYYWSSSLYSSEPDRAYTLNLSSSTVCPQGNNRRYYGMSVRPVSD